MLMTDLATWLTSAILALQEWVAATTWVDATEFFFVTMSVVGQHFISQRNPRGFAFWIAGNVAALVMFCALQRWMTTMLYLYFLFMCFKGLTTWRKLDAGTDAHRGAAPEPGARLADAA
jgi:nicotinamide mononucleotide transporter